MDISDWNYWIKDENLPRAMIQSTHRKHIKYCHFDREFQLYNCKIRCKTYLIRGEHHQKWNNLMCQIMRTSSVIDLKFYIIDIWFMLLHAFFFSSKISCIDLWWYLMDLCWFSQQISRVKSMMNWVILAKVICQNILLISCLYKL